MMEEKIFTCCEIDEEKDYFREFKEVVDNIAKYLENVIGVDFIEKESYLQAIDVYDCNYILYVADLKQFYYKIVLKVPFDQFSISIEDSNQKRVIETYCGISIPQYEQDNLDCMKKVLTDFERKFNDIKNR